MKIGEEEKSRNLLAKLSHEDWLYWHGQPKPLEQCLADSNKLTINEEIRGKNVILVAEENGATMGLCWCTVVDRGIDKQGEIAEFYVEKEYRGKGVGKELLEAAKQLFIDEKVEVAFVWTHYGNEAAISLYKNVGFKEVTQLVMAFVPSGENTTNTASRRPQAE
jgi:ribosomal protein S18 acetylase RimI-like enzyme